MDSPAPLEPRRKPLLNPPAAPRRPTVLEAHGDWRIDDWYWLRDRDDPEVSAYLEAENDYTKAASAHTEALQESLYQEILSRIKETDLSVPVRKGPWLYYTRTVQGRQYPIHCRKPAGGAQEASGGGEAAEPGEVSEAVERVKPRAAPDPGEQVLLDQNDLARDSEYFALGGLAISPDHELLAYSTDTTGAELYRLRFKDLSSKTTFSETIEDTYYGLAWAADSRTVFYTRPDRAMRPFQLWRHTVGTSPAEDRCVYQEDDARFSLGLSATKDDQLVLLELSSNVTTEVRFIRASCPEDEFRVIEPRSEGVEYSVDHRDGKFLIVTNDQAENFRLVQVPVDTPGLANGSDLVGHREDVKLDGIDVFSRHLVLFERAEGSTRISIMNLAEDGTHDTHVVEQPEAVSTVWGGLNPEPDTSVLRYEYSSLITPRSVYDYDMRTRTAALLKREPVLGNYDPGDYRTERQWASARDGTRIPISVVYKKELVRDGSAPCLLYGYGSYEHSVDPIFSSIRLSLLERGFVFAIAHVRGGGEMGRRWYTAGKLHHKQNTFTDFIACARELVGGGWTSPERLVARGASAGGMLMGVVANAAPELFRAIVAEVPFMDCLTTILDESLPLTIFEWEEWGNPGDDPEVYEYMKSYSPYDNVTSARYPDMLVTAGLNDPRVSFWEPAKWTARLRAANRANRVLLKTEMGAGHRGPSGRYDAWQDEAFVLAFMLDAVGINS